MDFPLVVNSKHTGDMKAYLIQSSDSEPKVDIPVEQFLKLISSYADKEQITQWFKQEEKQYLPLSELRNRGLDITFDQNALTINVNIPQFGTQEISLKNNRQFNLDQHYAQSGIVSGLNFYLKDRFIHKSNTIQKTGLSGTNIDISGFTSFGGFGGVSLFYEADYRKNDDQPITRGDITLIHDSFKQGTRLSIGDFRPSTSRFQSSPDMLGINFERNYSEINPFKNLRPNGYSTFTLEDDSKVQFEVNGTIVSTENLTAGSYSINDFPLISGNNNVKIWIDDGSSKIEVANFSTYVDTTLLAKDVTNFGISLGFQRERTRDKTRHYSDDLSLLGFYEKGVQDNLTLAMQAELAENHTLLSSSLIYGSRIGVFALETAVSKRKNYDIGHATVLGYHYQTQKKSDWFSRTDFQASFRSDSFISLSETLSRPKEWSLNARSSFGKNGTTLSLSGEVRNTNNITTQRLSTSISKSFSSFALSLGYQYLISERLENGSDSIFSLNISKKMGDARLRTRYNSSSNRTSAEWANTSSRNIGDIRSRVSVTSDDNNDGAEIDAGYLHSRFALDLRHRTSNSNTSTILDSSATDINLSTGLGYADGKFAYGRAFTNGFIIIDRHKNLKGKKIAVTRGSSKGDIVASTKLLNTVLIPINNSYRLQRFLFSVDDLPVGYDIGSGDVRLFPGSFSGFRFPIGSDASNTLIGKLISPSGNPVGLLSGKLIPKSYDGKSIVVFTNRTGRFVAEKVRAGNYLLVIGKNDEWISEIKVIRNDEPGLVQLGDIILNNAK